MRFILSFVALFIFVLSGNNVKAELSPIKEADVKEEVQQNETVKKEEKKVNSLSAPATKEKKLVINTKNIIVDGVNKNSNENTENIVKVKENSGDIYINIEPKVNVSCAGTNCNQPCDDKKKPVVKKQVKKKKKIQKNVIKKSVPTVQIKTPDPLEVYGDTTAGDITEDDWVSKTKPKDFLYNIECINKCKTKLNYNVSDQDIANLPLQDESNVVVAPLLPEPDVIKIMEQPVKQVEEPVITEEPQVLEKQEIYKEKPENLNVITEIIIDNERISLIDNNAENVSTKNTTKSSKTQSYNYNTSNKAFAFADNID